MKSMSPGVCCVCGGMRVEEMRGDCKGGGWGFGGDRWRRERGGVDRDAMVMEGTEG